jgi:cyclopropane fatty-acyl-phospholipid synthase-like methyltransferase
MPSPTSRRSAGWSQMASAIDRSVFDELYRDSGDPWRFETSVYEARKRAISLASLPRQRYARAFEPGCSIGTLTEQLAGRCDQLLAADVSELAVARARERLGDQPHVRIEKLEVPLEWPTGSFDLIVLSELGYFLAAAELDTLLDHVTASLAVGGDLLAVHWLGPIDGYPLDGRDVHERIAERGLDRLVHHEEREFLLEVFRR